MNKKFLVIWAIANLIFLTPCIVTTAQAGWWDDVSDTADDWWNEGTDAVDDYWNDANDWWDDTYDDTQDWWNENKDDAEEWYNDMVDESEEWWNENSKDFENWLSENYDEFEELWNENSEQAKQYWNMAYQKSSEWWDNSIEATWDTWNQHQDDWKKEAEDFSELLDEMGAWSTPYVLIIDDQNIDEVCKPLTSKDLFETIDYIQDRRQRTTQLYLDFARTIISDASNDNFAKNAWEVIPDGIYDHIKYNNYGYDEIKFLEDNKEIISKGTIRAINALPVYDPQNQRIISLDRLAKDMVLQNPSLNHYELGLDPVKIGTLLLLNSDYMMYAKIIPTEYNDNYLSIQEALNSGTIDITTLNRIQNNYDQALLAYSEGDDQKFEQNMQSFAYGISSISPKKPNEKSNFPWWIIFFGVIGLVLIFSLAAVGIKIRKRKKSQNLSGASVEDNGQDFLHLPPPHQMTGAPNTSQTGSNVNNDSISTDAFIDYHPKSENE